MDWKEHARKALPDYLDAQGDCPPPWARFPEYERYTIGWRMGIGESYLGVWHVFLEQLDHAPSEREAYLRRHPTAPVSWSDVVYRVLHPAEDDEDADGAPGDACRSDLLARGLIGSDVAYGTWLALQDGVRWPWEDSKTPEDAARHWTRQLWFWSRQLQDLRSPGTLEVPRAPLCWRACAQAARTGTLTELDPSRGLQALTLMLSAGELRGPWQLGLAVSEFADSFDDDMGYVDAFRLWGTSAFDDREHAERTLAELGMPAEWQGWAREQLFVF